MEPILITAGVVVGVLFLVLIVMYNGFVSRRNRMRNAFASIDVQLKKRWDLVPQLVETVRGYASHEKDGLREGDPGTAGDRARWLRTAGSASITSRISERGWPGS